MDNTSFCSWTGGERSNGPAAVLVLQALCGPLCSSVTEYAPEGEAMRSAPKKWAVRRGRNVYILKKGTSGD